MYGIDGIKNKDKNKKKQTGTFTRLVMDNLKTTQCKYLTEIIRLGDNSIASLCNEE